MLAALQAPETQTWRNKSGCEDAIQLTLMTLPPPSPQGGDAEKGAPADAGPLANASAPTSIGASQDMKTGLGEIRLAPPPFMLPCPACILHHCIKWGIDSLTLFRHAAGQSAGGGGVTLCSCGLGRRCLLRRPHGVKDFAATWVLCRCKLVDAGVCRSVLTAPNPVNAVISASRPLRHSGAQGPAGFGRRAPITDDSLSDYRPALQARRSMAPACPPFGRCADVPSDVARLGAGAWAGGTGGGELRAAPCFGQPDRRTGLRVEACGLGGDRPIVETSAVRRVGQYHPALVACLRGALGGGSLIHVFMKDLATQNRQVIIAQVPARPRMTAPRLICGRLFKQEVAFVHQMREAPRACRRDL